MDPGFTNNAGQAGIQYAGEQMLKEKPATADKDIAEAVRAMKPPEEADIPPELRRRTRAREVLERATADEIRAG